MTYIHLERHIREAIKSMNKEFLDIQHITSKTTVKEGDIINFYSTQKVPEINSQMSLF